MRSTAANLAPANPFDHLPPHDLDAEAAVLGALLIAGGERATWPIFDRAAALLWREAFYLADHQIAYDALRDLRGREVPTEAVTVRDEIGRRGLLADVGGATGLAELLGGNFTAAHADHYAGIVAGHGRARAAIGVATDLAARLNGPAHPPTGGADDGREAVVREAAAALLNVAGRGVAARVQTAGDAARDFLGSRDAGRASAQLVGLPSLDRHFAGFLRRGQYAIVAARPSMGKSAFVKFLLLTLARGGTPVGLIAVEENAEKVVSDLLAAISGVPNTVIRDGEMGPRSTPAGGGGGRRAGPTAVPDR